MSRRLRKTVPKERLSHSEWEIMRICWRLGHCTVREVLKEDHHRPKRDYRTILTFMTRMERKGWLQVEKDGNTNCYSPAVNRKKALQSEIDRFFEDVVGSDPEGLELVRRAFAAKKR